MGDKSEELPQLVQQKNNLISSFQNKDSSAPIFTADEVTEIQRDLPNPNAPDIEEVKAKPQQEEKQAVPIQNNFRQKAPKKPLSMQRQPIPAYQQFAQETFGSQSYTGNNPAIAKQQQYMEVVGSNKPQFGFHQSAQNFNTLQPIRKHGVKKKTGQLSK